MTLYETLGVATDADSDTIRRAYRRLAKTCHPDVSKDSQAEERFKALGRAYEILSDCDKRCIYDVSIRELPIRSGDSLFGFSASITFDTEYGEVTFQWD